jgi:pimeloyl-ACP methyl ester carboxylesterase
MQEKGFLLKAGLPPATRIDMSKLILGGHSFGGMTALHVAKDDNRVKLCGTLDPFLFSHHKEVLAGEFVMPIPSIAVSSEMFHPSIQKGFPSWDTLKALFNHSKAKEVENVVVKRTGHLHQCDLASLIPFELYILSLKWPQRTTNETYQLHSELLLDFFFRRGFMAKGAAQPEATRAFIAHMKEDWLKYDIQCD